MNEVRSIASRTGRNPNVRVTQAKGYQFHSLPTREPGYEEITPLRLPEESSEDDYEEDPDDPDRNCCESLVLGCRQAARRGSRRPQ